MSDLRWSWVCFLSKILGTQSLFPDLFEKKYFLVVFNSPKELAGKEPKFTFYKLNGVFSNLLLVFSEEMRVESGKYQVRICSIYDFAQWHDVYIMGGRMLPWQETDVRFCAQQTSCAGKTQRVL